MGRIVREDRVYTCGEFSSGNASSLHWLPNGQVSGDASTIYVCRVIYSIWGFREYTPEDCLWVVCRTPSSFLMMLAILSVSKHHQSHSHISGKINKWPCIEEQNFS